RAGGVVLPRIAAEVALPVAGRAIRRAGNPDVPVAFGIGARRARLHEPWMLIRGLVGHQIDDHAHPAAMRLCDQAIEGGEIAEIRVDAAVVADVVAPVVERRRIDGVQPDGVDAERVRRAVIEIVEMRGNAVEIADAVSVRIGKRARIDLIENGALPPLESHCTVRGGAISRSASPSCRRNWWRRIFPSPPPKDSALTARTA